MKTKQKRMPRLSIIRLYKMAQKFGTPSRINTKEQKILTDFLEYINNHKNDTL